MGMIMQKAQVFLREDQKTALRNLSRRTGRKQSELIRHGVDLAIAEAEKMPEEDWRAAWRAAAGSWSDRSDIDELYAGLRENSQKRADDLAKHWRRK
jgi:hypothetical protein